jgi:outer membrane protein OmpA-like peptidoglycan-associated protein
VSNTTPLLIAPKGEPTQLKSIRFAQSKPELLPDSQGELDQLLAFMNGNPKAEIELAGHTDNQGGFEENIQLSRLRVEAVKEYLVRNGIAASRIVAKGYGPSRPIASNNHEETRRLNRRVEFTVTKE